MVSWKFAATLCDKGFPVQAWRGCRGGKVGCDCERGGRKALGRSRPLYLKRKEVPCSSSVTPAEGCDCTSVWQQSVGGSPPIFVGFVQKELHFKGFRDVRPFLGLGVPALVLMGTIEYLELLPPCSPAPLCTRAVIFPSCFCADELCSSSREATLLQPRSQLCCRLKSNVGFAGRCLRA